MRTFHKNNLWPDTGTEFCDLDLKQNSRQNATLALFVNVCESNLCMKA